VPRDRGACPNQHSFDVGRGISQEQSERAGDLVRKALPGNPAIKGVYSVSSGAAAVVAALKAFHRQDVVFITHELTPDHRELLRQGLIDAIIDQNPSSEVRAAIESMARLVGRLDEYDHADPHSHDGEYLEPPHPQATRALRT